MIDGSLMEDSKTPSTFEYNVRSRQVVNTLMTLAFLSKENLGTLGGIEDGVGSGQNPLTDPDQAVELWKRTVLTGHLNRYFMRLQI